MLPVLKGVIARRVLLNFRADPQVVQRWLPTPFEAEQREGSAIVGVCLIRLERLRPKGFPGAVGLASENMAHRVAVRYPGQQGPQRAVFIWRRETDQTLMEMFGGRIFPGVHDRATFQVREDDTSLSMNVSSADGRTDVSFSASTGVGWQPTQLFRNLDEASHFFQGGDCGFSSSLDGRRLEGMHLKSIRWSISPLFVQLNHAAFYFNPKSFPPGSVEFDCGLMMRSVPHEWHEIKQCPAVEGIPNILD